jgi:hypothetical protein
MAWHWNGNSSTAGFQSGAVSGFAPGMNGNNNNGSPGGPLANYSVCTIAVPTVGAGGCYANCDSSTAPPILNANDFQCFLNKFAIGDPSANCDGSTAPPVLNANDFQCFLNNFAAGCS